MLRRSFLKLSTSALASTILPVQFGALKNGSRKFTMSLNPGAIGVGAPLDELISYAADFRFEALSPPVSEVRNLSDAQREAVLARLKQHNLAWGSAGLPVDFRKDAATFKSGVEALPGTAAQLKKAGVTRMNTWIMPRHDTLTYRENFAQHAARLREIATILGDNGIRLGLEYVGPYTLRARWRYSFVHSLKETQELLAAIDRPNAGVVLDSFHWFTAHETAEDLLSLNNADIVACDLNDARIGFSVDEQVDGKRMLPAATGVIDLKAFLEVLIGIGYDGPVRAEPFNKTLNDLPNEPAVAATSAAMHEAFNLI
ncbi:MAG: sugar phosphate isomerase/epimerase family protein [Bacteroidota bacterium]